MIVKERRSSHKVKRIQNDKKEWFDLKSDIVDASMIYFKR